MKPTPLPRFVPLERTTALSDAVFAVVMTLLVLGIEVPEGGTLVGPELAPVREGLGHQLLVYFVSFWIVAMYWSQQSLLFSSLKRMDGALFTLNLAFLLPVTLLPFVTQLMGATHANWDVVAVFALTNLFAAFALGRMWRHAVATPDLCEGERTASLEKRVRFGLRVFATALPAGVLLALIDVRIGILCFVLTPVGHFYNYIRGSLRGQPPS